MEDSPTPNHQDDVEKKFWKIKTSTPRDSLHFLFFSLCEEVEMWTGKQESNYIKPIKTQSTWHWSRNCLGVMFGFCSHLSLHSLLHSRSPSHLKKQCSQGRSKSIMGSSITRTCQCRPTSIDAVRHRRCYLSLHSLGLSDLEMANIKISSLETNSQNIKGIYQ